jgi:hypothetical protein
MAFTTLTKQGAFDADVENQINANFSAAAGSTTQMASGSFILASSANNLTLAGNAGNNQNYANGLQLNAAINVVSTANNNNNSAILPPSTSGMHLSVYNANSAATISIFPQKNEHVNFAANNAAYTLATNNVTVLECATKGTWMASQAAIG